MQTVSGTIVWACGHTRQGTWQSSDPTAPADDGEFKSMLRCYDCDMGEFDDEPEPAVNS